MHLDEYKDGLNFTISVFASFSTVVFLLSSAQTKNPMLIASETVLFICLALFWFVNRKFSTGNTAFENHQDGIAQNMKKEREAFIKFLEQEREAEDSAAFAKFMKSK